MTVYLYYQDVFPESEEERHLIVVNHPVLPDDRYILAERYCADPECDCRLARLEICSEKMDMSLAVICYALDGPAKTPKGRNPFLEPMVSHPPMAAELLELVSGVIREDDHYRERLERHYLQLKQQVLDHPDPELAERIAADRRIMTSFAEGFVRRSFPGDSRLPSNRGGQSKNRKKNKNKRKAQRRARKRNR